MKAFVWAVAVLAAAVVLGVVVGSQAWQPGSLTPAWIQAFGTVVAICVAIFMLWIQHGNDPAGAPQPRMEEPVAPMAAAPIAKTVTDKYDFAHTHQMEERLARMEAAACAATQAMKMIDEAWAGVGDKSAGTMAYVGEGFSRAKFEQAEAALHDIHVAQLADSEIAKPIVELRSHVVRAASLVEGISQAEQEGRAREEIAGRISLASIREQSHGHAATIEAAAARMRDALE